MCVVLPCSPDISASAELFHRIVAGCDSSIRGKAKIVLPNRPADIDRGGSYAAASGVWAGPSGPQRGAAARPRPSSVGQRYLIRYPKFHVSYKN